MVMTIFSMVFVFCFGLPRDLTLLLSTVNIFSHFITCVFNQNLAVSFFCAARVMTNKVTGRSRGYGFVNFISEDSANSAISAMNGQVRNLKNH